MKSTDLVDWQLVSYAYDILDDVDELNLTTARTRMGVDPGPAVFAITTECSTPRRFPARLAPRTGSVDADFVSARNTLTQRTLLKGLNCPGEGSHIMQKTNWNSALNRRDWMMTAGGLLLAVRAAAQSKLLPLNSSGLDHLSITLPDSAAAATFYGKIFDPQVFHERTGVQRYYVRLGSAYLAFGPQANATPYIDHIAAGVIDFVEDDFGKPEIKDQITAAGLAAPPGVLPMLSDPDNLRLQLVNTTHGLFDTLMPGGRVTIEPPALTPIGIDHIMVSVTNVERSAAHYRKLFGPETSRDRNPDHVWFKLADSKLGLETVASGQKPGFSHYCVKVAGFDRAAATAKLAKLGLRVEAGSENGTLRFRDLHNLPVEVVAG